VIAREAPDGDSPAIHARRRQAHAKRPVHAERRFANPLAGRGVPCLCAGRSAALSTRIGASSETPRSESIPAPRRNDGRVDPWPAMLA